VSLVACLVYVTSAQAANVPATSYVPVTMLITAAIFAVASLPVFVFLRERAVPVPASLRPGTAVRDAFARLHATWRDAHRYRDLQRFLACLVFYQAGIQAVVALAAIYAHEVMGFTMRDTLLLIVVVNVTAAAGAYAFGQFQDRLGHARTLALTLIGWIAAIVLAWLATGPALFWAAANLVGVCLGASQSAGRALVGYLSPPGRTAEFFALWGVAVKLSSILGPVTYGLVTWLSHGDHRLAILITGVYFLAGLGLLKSVNVARGRAAALAAPA
jgi:UMF1 family MFS transporter